MSDITDEFLCLVCRVCSARSARLIIRSGTEDGLCTVLDTTSRARPELQAPVEHQSPQIRFLLQEPAGRKWNLRRSGSSMWRFSSESDDLRADLVLEYERGVDGRIGSFLDLASGFLELLEAIVPVAGIEGAESGRSGGSGGGAGAVPFDPPMYGVSEDIVRLREKVRVLSLSAIPVLIEGENGTGKEIVARNIHRLGERRNNPLVIVNCMEMPATLLQGELFGHVKGSFTGAQRDRRGLVECAGGGTFFLDEIGEMPLHLQAALLRVIQEKEVRRIGESFRRNVDARFVFATNRDLGELVRSGRFRKDLYFRIKGVRMLVPPLRHRRSDIVPLASRFLESAAAGSGCRAPVMSVKAAHELYLYDWPGNVRELKNEMERVVALYPGAAMVRKEMLSESVRENRKRASAKGLPRSGTLNDEVRKLELKMIREALETFDSNRTRTAQALGITRQGLLKKMKRYDLI